MLLLNIISIITYFHFSSSYLSIPFQVKSNVTKDENDIMPYLLFKGIYINIKFGSENEEFSLPLKMKTYPLYISSSSSNIKSKKYNEKSSKTYIKLENTTITSNQDLIEGYKSLDTISINNITINKYSFILTEKQITEESGGIGLKIAPTFEEYGIYKNISSFITQLKKNNFINSFSFSFKYKNENEGLFIIGAEPDEIDPKHYNENNSITVKSSLNYGGGRWMIKLYNVTFNGKQVFIGPYSYGEILSEVQFIYGVNNFRKIISSDFFNQSGCFEKYNEKFGFTYFYCNENIDIKKFNDLIFTSEEKNHFIFTYKDLFYNFKGFNYFLVVFGKDNSWSLGQIFLRKYYTVFNSDKKVVKWYFYEEKKGNFNVLLFFCIIFFIIIIGLVIYLYYFKKTIILKKKKRANELEDDYEYIPEKKSDLEMNKNKLFSSLI